MLFTRSSIRACASGSVGRQLGMATTQTQIAPTITSVASPARRRLRRWAHSRNLLLGLGIMLALVLVAAFAPLLTPYQPQEQNYDITLQSPSLAHPFGTDNFGRDILTRVLYGTRIDLRVGLISVLPPLLIGVVPGSLAGYYGRWGDSIVMRVVDLVQAFPFLVLVIFIVAVLGPGLRNMYIAVAVTAWFVYARLIRGNILVEKNKEYVIAAQAIGGSDWRVISKHIFPNVFTSCII